MHNQFNADLNELFSATISLRCHKGKSHPVAFRVVFANTVLTRNEGIAWPLRHWDDLGLEGPAESCSRGVDGTRRNRNCSPRSGPLMSTARPAVTSAGLMRPGRVRPRWAANSAIRSAATRSKCGAVAPRQFADSRGWRRGRAAVRCRPRRQADSGSCVGLDPRTVAGPRLASRAAQGSGE
jgi:hypothetical protein